MLHCVQRGDTWLSGPLDTMQQTYAVPCSSQLRQLRHDNCNLCSSCTLNRQYNAFAVCTATPLMLFPERECCIALLTANLPTTLIIHKHFLLLESKQDCTECCSVDTTCSSIVRRCCTSLLSAKLFTLCALCQSLSRMCLMCLRVSKSAADNRTKAPL